MGKKQVNNFAPFFNI